MEGIRLAALIDREEGKTKMTFEQRMEEVREMLAVDEQKEEAATSPSWDDDMFKNGWPNCWGDFNNIMK
jgi:hypothetical protein